MGAEVSFDDLDKSLADVNDLFCRPEFRQDLGDVLAGRALRLTPDMSEADIVAEIDAILERTPILDELLSGRAQFIGLDEAEDADLQRRLANIRSILRLDDMPVVAVLTTRERIHRFLETYSPPKTVLREDGNVTYVKFGGGPDAADR
jgi:hypothetical protein